MPMQVEHSDQWEAYEELYQEMYHYFNAEWEVMDDAA